MKVKSSSSCRFDFTLICAQFDEARKWMYECGRERRWWSRSMQLQTCRCMIVFHFSLPSHTNSNNQTYLQLFSSLTDVDLEYQHLNSFWHSIFHLSSFAFSFSFSIWFSFCLLASSPSWANGNLKKVNRRRGEKCFHRQVLAPSDIARMKYYIT
jgi:hypothetical protein